MRRSWLDRIGDLCRGVNVPIFCVVVLHIQPVSYSYACVPSDIYHSKCLPEAIMASSLSTDTTAPTPVTTVLTRTSAPAPPAPPSKDVGQLPALGWVICHTYNRALY